jgi:secondary thiamine-phosphate synthase enzyme
MSFSRKEYLCARGWPLIVTSQIDLRTRGNGDMIDITSRVYKAITDSDIKDGVVAVFVNGSTAGVTTIEFEPGLVADFQRLWERLAPANIPYDHNERWADGNGFSHVRASLLGASLTVPVVNRTMALGTWQQIVLVDFDNRPRSRTVVVQVMGE